MTFARVLPVPVAEAERLVRDLSALGHPNVIGPVGAGEREGEALVVQEVPDGVPLTQWVAKQRTGGRIVPLADVERILRQVVTALRHAHQAGVCHGGLTSSHVFLATRASGDFQVQVADFGIVPLVAAHCPTFPVHAWWHLAPEIATKPAAVTPSADLFALGVLLVELLAGVALVPPTGTTPWREFASARTASIRSTIAQARPDASDALLDLAASLLHPLPATARPPPSWTSRACSRASPGSPACGRASSTRSSPATSRRPRRPAPSSAPRRSPRRATSSCRARRTRARFHLLLRRRRSARRSPRPPCPRRPCCLYPRPRPQRPRRPSPRCLSPRRRSPRHPRRRSPRSRRSPAPVAARDDDATLSEGAAPAAARALADATVHAPPRRPSPAPQPPSPSSWFASEATVVTPPIPTALADDTTLDKRAPSDATLTDATLGEATGPVPVVPAAAPAGFFRAEGTAVLAHPDQLAQARDDVSASEANAFARRGPSPRRRRPSPRRRRPSPPLPPVPPLPPLSAGAPFMLAVETTQPEIAVLAARAGDRGAAAAHLTRRACRRTRRRARRAADGPSSWRTARSSASSSSPAAPSSASSSGAS